MPIHPLHVERIDADLREHIYLENGLRRAVRRARRAVGAATWPGCCPASELIADCDVILLPKPLPQDLAELRDGQILWGWPHCVQDAEITQLAIDRRLTLIAFEAMNHWTPDGGFSLHVFHKNNELAGYCSVLHALRADRDDRRLRPSAARGRHRLRSDRPRRGDRPQRARCRTTSTCSPSRGVAAVASPIHSVRIVQFDQRRRRPQSQLRARRRRPGAAGRRSSPSTTSSSTACCRTPTRR